MLYGEQSSTNNFMTISANYAHLNPGFRELAGDFAHEAGDSVAGEIFLQVLD